jgi:hypothetical protein
LLLSEHWSVAGSGFQFLPLVVVALCFLPLAVILWFQALIVLFLLGSHLKVVLYPIARA